MTRLRVWIQMGLQYCRSGVWLFRWRGLADEHTLETRSIHKKQTQNKNKHKEMRVCLGAGQTAHPRWGLYIPDEKSLYDLMRCLLLVSKSDWVKGPTKVAFRRFEIDLSRPMRIRHAFGKKRIKWEEFSNAAHPSNFALGHLIYKYNLC